MSTQRDWDIKIDQGGTEHRFRLLQQQGQKSWAVSEIPPTPQISSEAGAREGFAPDRELPFVQEDWSWGMGLERFGSSQDRGHLLRFADGFNIDTTQPGTVRHGPLETAVGGALQTLEVPRQFVLFQNTVYFHTKRRLYAVEGGVPVEKHDFVGNTILDMAVFAGRIYLCTTVGNEYSEWDGTTMTAKSVAGGALLFLAAQGATAPILVRVLNDNFISTTTDPSNTALWDVPGVEVGEGDTITSLFVISGFVFVATQSTIYILATDTAGVSVPIELNRLLQNRRSPDTYRIKAESGSDVWLTDTRDIIRIVAEGFEIFDFRFNGPFRSFDERPVSLDFPGEVKAMAQDADAIYILAVRGSETFIYKGVELVRGVFSWCPWAKFDGIVDTGVAIIKTPSDDDPFLYVGTNEALVKFQTENWTTFAATWELQTPQFTATLETWDKMWKSIAAFISRTGTGKLEVFYRLNNDTTYLDFDDATSTINDMADDGFNELKLAAPINGKKIQLLLRGSRTTTTDKCDLRSFNLSGLLRPDREPIFDFTIIADTATEITFINALRTDVTQFFTITDRFGVARTCFMLPGYPIEQEQSDEARKEPVRTYRIVAQEIT